MITFFTTAESEDNAAVEDTLDDLCMTHETVTVKSARDLPPEVPSEGGLPVLVDEHDVFQGIAAILEHLQALEAFKAQWYKFQSDACYVDEEGNVE